MDIMLIDPPYITLKDVPVDSCYNVGIVSLAAYLRRAGMETAVVMGDVVMNLPSRNLWLTMNMQKFAAGQQTYGRIVGDDNHFIWRRIADLVRQAKPAAVGISYLTPSRYAVEKIAHLVKEVNRDIKVITGSSHPTLCPEEVMQNPHIDFAAVGEGEIPLLSLVSEMKKDNPRWETVPGIYYREKSGEVRHTPCAELIANLDELPFLGRDLVMDADYGRYRAHSISTSRGCPYTCGFCADRFLWQGKVRRRSVQNVMQELYLLKDTYPKISYVDFTDGTFTYDRKYVQAFCDAMIDRKLGIKWRCTARYDNIDEPLLKVMKAANCDGLYLGLESGSDRVLKSIDKKITTDKIIKVSDMVYGSGIPSATAILLGFPDETKEDIAETLKLMRRIRTDIFDVNIYTPLPGTPLYDAVPETVRKDIDWRKVGFKSLDTYFGGCMPFADFARYRDEAYAIADGVRKKTIARFILRKAVPFWRW